ncbi:MAG: hypothetical protein ACTII7_09765 [Galactobacter sp.]
MRHPLTLTAATACAAALLLTGCTNTDEDKDPNNSVQSPVHSAPAGSSAPTEEKTPSADASTSAKPSNSAGNNEDANPANIIWGSKQRIIPKTGPIKLPAPKTSDAALETTFQIVQRYSNDSQTIRNSGSTDISRAEPYVTGRLLEQIKLEAKEFKKREIRSTGDVKLERILGQQDSYAGTGKVVGKDGKSIATKYSSVTLNLCVDNSAVKVTGDVETPSETRRVFTAKSQYIPTTKTWTLSEYRPAENGATC